MFDAGKHKTTVSRGLTLGSIKQPTEKHQTTQVIQAFQFDISQFFQFLLKL